MYLTPELQIDLMCLICSFVWTHSSSSSVAGRGSFQFNWSENSQDSSAEIQDRNRSGHSGCPAPVSWLRKSAWYKTDTDKMKFYVKTSCKLLYWIVPDLIFRIPRTAACAPEIVVIAGILYLMDFPISIFYLIFGLW